MSINQFIKVNNLQPADAVELANPAVGFPRHYAVYLGIEKGTPYFIANITTGVQVISKEKLEEFTSKYEVVGVERFEGNIKQRNMAIKNAIARIGEKAYNLVFNNCEHFKNWVLYGTSSSKQVELIGSSMLIGGGTLYLIGMAADSKGFKKAGTYILLILLAIILLAIIFYYANKKDD